jgi:hypothetical protein
VPALERGSVPALERGLVPALERILAARWMDWRQAQGLRLALARAKEAACQVLGLERGLHAAEGVRSLTQTHLPCACVHLTAPR